MVSASRVTARGRTTGSSGPDTHCRHLNLLRLRARSTVHVPGRNSQPHGSIAVPGLRPVARAPELAGFAVRRAVRCLLAAVVQFEMSV